MAAWIVGDTHGCEEEFAKLVDRLQRKPENRLQACGGLFQRGPDPDLAGSGIASGRPTPCVHGGRSTTYSPELDEVITVPARKAWVAKA